MDEKISEKEAQLQYENKKLQDELNHLRDQALSLEENYNSALSEKESYIKNLEQQLNIVKRNIREKNHTIDSLEQFIENASSKYENLTAELNLVKKELMQEKIKTQQIEEMKLKEEDLKNAYAKLKQENCRLSSELSLNSFEQSAYFSTVEDLLLQIKELQEINAELKSYKDFSNTREKEVRSKTKDYVENILKKSPEWCLSKSQLSLLTITDNEPVAITKEKENVNLHEEILEAEVNEKQIMIQHLESLLGQREEEKSELIKFLKALKGKLDESVLLKVSNEMFLKLDESFYITYNQLANLIIRPEGPSAECKPLTEIVPLSVTIKDGVQTTQPGPIRVVETISIASQTDPIKNLSPVLQFKAFENCTNKEQSLSDSDDEGQSLSVFKENEFHQSWQIFSEHKNCDLDMDMYRSCRKLSVLPEEENDDFCSKKSSLKNFERAKNYTKIKLKTQSANDVSKNNSKIYFQKAASCSSVFDKNIENYSLENTDLIHGKSQAKEHFVMKNGNSELFDETLNSKELSLLVPPRNSLKQPHSFDSYLDPQQSPSSLLPRQISDPTQNSVFAPPITRRGSYIKKPRSTCRPLRLLCDKNDRKKEERFCKVRFDLSGTMVQHDKKAFNAETPRPVSILNENEKVKFVSRFRVEIIDEVEFRKSIEENIPKATRKRPPLIHSIMYKKSVFNDLTNVEETNPSWLKETSKSRIASFKSVDNSDNDIPNEMSPTENLDIDDSLVYNSYPVKRRRQSDSSYNSIEDSQDNSDENDIFKKSIKLHTNSECIIMKKLSRESSDSSDSTVGPEIPYIDAEDLPVIKPNPEILKLSSIASILPTESQKVTIVSLGSPSEGLDVYFTPSEETSVTEESEMSYLGAPKSTGLSKSPTVLKNLVNFDLLTAMVESKKSGPKTILEDAEYEDAENIQNNVKKEQDCSITEKSVNKSLKRTSSDVSEASESDTLTYGTVKSYLIPSSDCESDTYVTILSDKSCGLERKFSDLSENSSSPYNTPPDTSSASFCTPPDTYSPLLNLIKKFPGSNMGTSYKNTENNFAENKFEEFINHSHKDCTGSVSPSCFSSSFTPENNANKKISSNSNLKYEVIFDSPKLEFYETDDSVENLEAFLQTEEGLADYKFKTMRNIKENDNLDIYSRSFETEEEFQEALSKRGSLESPKLSERRSKRYPPLSRQNSTEEYIFLDPHDSCLNLSEEISSPSTTPDTSNKTVIFKNIPLTVSNTIDLEDDFPISEAEMQVNFNGSQIEILEIPPPQENALKTTKGDAHCLSEPCTPSISSLTDFPEFSIPRKQRSSFTDESLICAKYESYLPVPPEIIVSNLSSDSENSESDLAACASADFASNVSDRSEVHLSDLNSISEHSDNCGSLSDQSNIVSDVFSSDSDKSGAISSEVSLNSSSSQISDKISANAVEDFGKSEIPESQPVRTFENSVLVSDDRELPATNAEVQFFRNVENSSLNECSSRFNQEEPATLRNFLRGPQSVSKISGKINKLRTNE